MGAQQKKKNLDGVPESDIDVWAKYFLLRDNKIYEKLLKLDNPDLNKIIAVVIAEMHNTEELLTEQEHVIHYILGKLKEYERLLNHQPMWSGGAMHNQLDAC